MIVMTLSIKETIDTAGQRRGGRIREPDPPPRSTPQHNQLMSERSVLRFKLASRFEWRSQDGQDKPEQSPHGAQAKRFSRQSKRIIFSVHTLIGRVGKIGYATPVSS
jgi:hypothetical protein